MGCTCLSQAIIMMEDVYNLYETYHESKIIHFSSSNLRFFMQMETSRVFKEILLLAQEYNINDSIFMLLTYTMS